jgi:transposase/FtsZ-binding cell division protein ZapB
LSKQTFTRDISKLLQSIEDIRLRCDNLDTEVVELKKENKQLRNDNKDLRIENKELRNENKQLKEKLTNLEHKKNSSNSSMSPSSDISKPKRTKSLRKESNKSLGGQVGHKGSTLRISQIPDKIEEYFPSVCESCGNNLSEATAKYIGRRQKIDIPPIHPVITEHIVYSKQCTCGNCTKAAYPSGVNSAVSYGSNIQALITYLSARQYIPINRIRELFTDVLNVNISEGGICYLLDKMAKKAKPEYEKIANSVKQEKVIGADETGANINGVNHWYWTFQSNLYTFIGIHRRRGFVALEDLFGNNFENACLVTDCWPAYFKTNANNHQLCLAHLQRELIGLSEKYPKQTWTLKLNHLFHKAYKLYQKHIDLQIPLDSSKKILEECNRLLNVKPKLDDKGIYAFYKRMIKYKNYLFNFLYDPNIPPDNNASERAIRNVKVKQKVSGLFKSFKGAENYATIRSCIDTSIKQGGKPLDTLYSIAISQPTE